MNEPLSLRTPRLTLEPLGKGDLDWFLDLNRKPEVRSHLWDDRLIGREEARGIIERSARAAVPDRLWIARQAVECIGYYGLWTFFDEAQPQLLYVTDPRFANRGFGKEAADVVVVFAFQRIGLNYLDATADERNAASIALARAVGFEDHARRKEPAGPQIVLRRCNPERR